jgi:hypothetical protein
MKQKETEKIPDKIHVNFQLQGEEVKRFLRYKQSQFLRNSSEAGRKLMMERLAELERSAA